MNSEKSIQNDIKLYWSNKIIFNEKKIKIHKSSTELESIDAFAILTEWDYFTEINYPKTSIIFDGRRVLNDSQTYFSIGS